MGTLQRFRHLRAILGRSAKWTVPVMAIGAATLPEGAATPTLPVWTQQAAAFIEDVSGRNSTVILLSATVLADWLAREAKNTAGEIRMGLRAALKKLRDEAREEAVEEAVEKAVEEAVEKTRAEAREALAQSRAEDQAAIDAWYEQHRGSSGMPAPPRLE